MSYLKLMLAMCLSLFTGVAYALPSLLQQLGIYHASLLSDGRYFGVSQQVWAFEEKSGFSYLLRQLEKQSLPFKQIEVWGGQFLLNGESQDQFIQLWVKRHGEEGFSGALSFWRSAPSIQEIKSIETLPQDTEVLLDMSTDKPEKIRQWIYLFPMSKKQSQTWMMRSLEKQGWVKGASMGDIWVWQRDNEQLHYVFEEMETKTSVYMLKKQTSVGSQ